MRAFDTVNILDMAGAIGEAKLQEYLSDFSCPVNLEIEHFIVNNAMDFAKKKLSVTYLVVMDMTFEILKKVQHDIGGGIVFLECENKVKLLDFYQSEKNGFIPFNDRYSINDNTKYIQLFHFF